jgi:hypothetical protein
VQAYNTGFGPQRQFDGQLPIRLIGPTKGDDTLTAGGIGMLMP